MFFSGTKEKIKKATGNLNPPHDEQYDGRRHQSKSHHNKYSASTNSQDLSTSPGGYSQPGADADCALPTWPPTSRKDASGPNKLQRHPQSYQQHGMSSSGYGRSINMQHQLSCYQDHEYHQADPREVIENLQEILRGRHQEIDALNTKTAALVRENEKLGEELLLLQEKSFSSMTDARLMPPDINSINAEITNVREMIGNFAKTYAAESLASIAGESGDAQLAFRSSLQHVVRFGGDGPKAVIELSKIKHAPRLLLAAFISHRIHKDILTKPFFFLDDGLDQRFEALRPKPKYDILKQRPNSSVSLNKIFEEIMTYDVQQAHKWRSDTLRLLHPKHLDTESAKARFQRSHAAIDTVAKHYAQILDEDMIINLLRPMETPVHSQFLLELTQIYITTGRLSVRLWSQRPAIACRFLPQLAHTPFDISSSILQAHALYKLDDPEDHSLDGKLTKILAAGLGEGGGVSVDGGQIIQGYNALSAESLA
ncbi:hypothetical protein CB0940_10103 [Cercospora beticola]|uniref:Uncharacterized protein n=1 Tax=Cercospora beticola TaxID=122368 RepID=A0A2G5HTT5_CERBT|nr:hypothetical protein CB0940_10103 [Cercospora beticola]PIA95693.1 hypothetical protein CB0940_10103 [Cercospora beticola]WPB06807.1 hypothetical protein RHO25_011467 [Cercospora beticola]